MLSKQLSAPASPSRAAWVTAGPLMPSGVPLPSSSNRIAARVLLPAAPVPAAAEPAVGHHPVVPGLARRAPPAAVELAVEHDPGADPGAHGDQHDVLLITGGTQLGLGPGGGVRVVLDDDR